MLLRFDGFPEPFFAQCERDLKLWLRERISRVVQEDLVFLEHVKEVSQLGLIAVLLQDRVGSLLSINSLRNDLAASHEAVSRWVQILENLYYCFRIRPYAAKKIKALKKDKKLYLWDWSLWPDPGSKFENLVASNLLKYCHYIEDTRGDGMELCFLRDNNQREVDFVVLRDKRPIIAVECKVGSENISKHLPYFSERTEIPFFYQVHAGEDNYEFKELRTRVMPFTQFVAEVLKC